MTVLKSKHKPEVFQQRLKNFKRMQRRSPNAHLKFVEAKNISRECAAFFNRLEIFQKNRFSDYSFKKVSTSRKFFSNV